MRRTILLCLLMGLLTSTCGRIANSTETAPTIEKNSISQVPIATVYASSTPSPAPTVTLTPTLQPLLMVLPSGLDAENFASGVNPLTGLRLHDQTMLDLPAVLVSISNMPTSARPQAGISFAPWIYEMFIGYGTTRFLSVFYGDLPRRIANDGGGCPVNTEIFHPTGAWIGKRVWLDENKDGIQDPWEAGVGGICVRLSKAGSGEKIASTSTDSNGYYAFDASNLQAGVDYTLDIKLPSAYMFTLANIGYENQDSDIDPAVGSVRFSYNGQVEPVLDAGVVLVKPAPPTFAVSEIAPERTYVGPIRSGRLTYNDFARLYPGGCLVYASAGDGIRQQLNGCEIIFGEQPGLSPNTALLDVSHLKELAQKSKIPNQPVNYSGHLFDPSPPVGGYPATRIWTFFHAFSQSSWLYNPISGSYLRQTDDGDGKGVFHADTDRLTGRQLAFENVVVILADYQIFRHAQYDISLCCGLEGYAFLFRDGQMYKIRWSTNNRAWEQKTGQRRPLHLTGADKQPFPLKPGRTWVSIMTINSVVKDMQDGKWQAYFSMPDDLPPEN